MSEEPKRLTPKHNTLRELFLKSGNQCAFPGCNEVIMNEKGEFIGQVCHIESALLGGERFNPDQTNEERRNFDNLMLMCYKHHKITNNVEEYSVDSLKKIKTNHENRHLEKKLNEKGDLSINDIVNKIDKDSNYKKKLKEYFWSPKAKNDFLDEVKLFKNLLIEKIEEINESYQNINLEHESVKNNVFSVIYRGNELALIYQAADLRVTSESFIIFKIYKNRHDDYYSVGHPRPKLIKTNQYEFSKDRNNDLIWISDSSKPLKSKELVGYILKQFINHFS